MRETRFVCYFLVRLRIDMVCFHFKLTARLGTKLKRVQSHSVRTLALVGRRIWRFKRKNAYKVYSR